MSNTKQPIYEIELLGCVTSNDDAHPLTEDEFLDKFIDFIESQNWSFGGGTRQIIDGYYVDQQLNPIKPVGEE